MTHRDEVLAALVAAGGVPVSGEDLAGKLHISRVAVGKHVAALRAVGYVIEAVPGTGYSLRERPDVAMPAEVVPLLASSLWTRIGHVDTTVSTNDDLKRAAREGAPHGSVLLASEQSSGRGRLGREWSSPRGGVYASMLLRPAMPLVQVAAVPLAVGLGVAWCLDEIGAGGARLKWPNDVWLEGRKVAGVLVESSAEADSVEWLVVGVGLNVRRPEQSRAERGHPDAAYVEDYASASVPAAAAALLDGVARAWERFAVEGFAGLSAEYEERSALTDRSVRVLDREGREQVAGVCAGVDEQGRLLVGTAEGVVPVASGDVTLDTDND
jgi:BirA family biotin operon repressor/biotin-[acetyl-CoA-carboxylase] ligase